MQKEVLPNGIKRSKPTENGQIFLLNEKFSESETEARMKILNSAINALEDIKSIFKSNQIYLARALVSDLSDLSTDLENLELQLLLTYPCQQFLPSNFLLILELLSQTIDTIGKYLKDKDQVRHKLRQKYQEMLKEFNRNLNNRQNFNFLLETGYHPFLADNQNIQNLRQAFNKQEPNAWEIDLAVNTKKLEDLYNLLSDNLLASIGVEIDEEWV